MAVQVQTFRDAYGEALYADVYAQYTKEFEEVENPKPGLRMMLLEKYGLLPVVKETADVKY